ncbi:hypothetical protein [Streptomyces sp. NPDC017202]|uniref:hypothetical protein n=1 Tax=Streptomyces sp. NPDC017202 TaxID=3364981 RepID=UPI0037B8953B
MKDASGADDADREGSRRVSPSEERDTVERLVPARPAETERHDPAAARRARTEWERGSLSARTAEDLATRVTASVTGTVLHEDEGPRVDGPARITPAGKNAVHRRLAGRGHGVRRPVRRTPVSTASRRVPEDLDVTVLPGPGPPDAPGDGPSRRRGQR